MTEIERAQRRLEAANLRVLAAGQRENARAHERQAGHPIYPGQDVICMDKAARILAMAERNEALATLKEVEAKEGQMSNKQTEKWIAQLMEENRQLTEENAQLREEIAKRKLELAELVELLKSEGLLVTETRISVVGDDNDTA